MIFLFAAGLVQTFLSWCGFGLEYSLQVSKMCNKIKQIAGAVCA